MSRLLITKALRSALPLAAVAVALTAATVANAQSSDDTIKRLERRIEELENRVKESRTERKDEDRRDPAIVETITGNNPNTLDTRKRPAYGFGNDTVKFGLGGYFSIVYRDEINNRRIPATFDQHRLVLLLNFSIAEKLRFESEIEIEGGGADVPFLTGQEILVEFAELTFDVHEAFAPKAGLLLIPFGRYNLIHDDPLHDLFDRPFVARRISPSAFDQPGVGATGSFRTRSFGFGYDISLTQGFRDNFGPNSGARDARQSFRSDENSDKAAWARVSMRPDLYELGIAEDSSLEVGASLNTQKVGAADHRLTGWGADFAFRWNSGAKFGIDAEGEYAGIDIRRDATVGVTGLWAYYGQMSLRFRPWDDGAAGGWLRDSGYLALVARYEENDLDDRAVGAALRDNREALTVGIAFRPFFKTVIRAEWKFVNTRGVAVDEADRFVFSLSTYF